MKAHEWNGQKGPMLLRVYYVPVGSRSAQSRVGRVRSEVAMAERDGLMLCCCENKHVWELRAISQVMWGIMNPSRLGMLTPTC